VGASAPYRNGHTIPAIQECDSSALSGWSGLPPDRVPVPVQRAYKLTVTAVSPSGVLVEHQPIRVSYELVVTVFGVTGELEFLAGSVCPEGDKGVCVKIPDLRAGTYRGTVEGRAPTAGAAAPINLQLVTWPMCPNDKPECFPDKVILAHGDRSLPGTGCRSIRHQHRFVQSLEDARGSSGYREDILTIVARG